MGARASPPGEQHVQEAGVKTCLGGCKPAGVAQLAVVRVSYCAWNSLGRKRRAEQKQNHKKRMVTLLRETEMQKGMDFSDIYVWLVYFLSSNSADKTMLIRL